MAKIKNSPLLPLHEKISLKNKIRRALFIIIFLLYLCLLLVRIQSLKQNGFTWLLAFLCESFFTFLWFLGVNNGWNPVEFRTYPDRLLSSFLELPPLDIFVTTADPVIEPPIITINTVLSLLALDYPVNKLACYVSDDAGSPITFYCLIEAFEFAKLWVPFCRKYNVQVRAPSRYFSKSELQCSNDLSLDFQKEWKKMKDNYDLLRQKIEEACQNNALNELTGDFEAFSRIERRDHSSIVKVIWENTDDNPDGLPHLIYVSREKRPKHPHHFKAGAMNVLTRVSGVMTNAPYMLNVDCDMFANNHQIALHAMCIFLDKMKERDYAFVQYPQRFYEGIKDDPFATNMLPWQEYYARGVAGIQGIIYMGSGCFHRRNIIYGLSPEEAQDNIGSIALAKGKPIGEVLKTRYGDSEKFMNSADRSISGLNSNFVGSISHPNTLKAAALVSGCRYESNTDWGTKVGWLYGSATEDVLTGQRIHEMGWSTMYCTPDPVAFLGCAPWTGPIVMVQQKRWCTGLLEILFSTKSPIIATIKGNLWVRQCFVYLSIYTWGLGSIPELCYAMLPAYCLLTNTSFMPKVLEPATFITAPLFLLYHALYLSECLGCGLSIRTWWNHRRMSMITGTTARLFSVLSIILKLLGLSETAFEVTPKDQNSSDDGTNTDLGRFTFDDSPMFVPGTALVMVHIVALGLSFIRMCLHMGYGAGPELVEIMCSAWVVVSLMPFVKGMFRKGKYGIPSTTLLKSAALAGLFVASVFGFQG